MTRERCSIVIPVHNKAALTRQCLDSIFERPPKVDHEVLVVDDASIDGTPDMLAEYGEAVKHVRLEQNAGFATACNAGAAAAKGEYLVFLNNDTIAQRGWLDALVAYADRHGVAVVGSKLLFPDGTVQHAGVAFSPLGDPLHIYAGFPADHPAVNRSRPFQAVTAACVLVRRDAFGEAGGFDTGYHNDLEDVDLCLRLGQAGHEVHYCHESVLYHLESASRGQRGRPKYSAAVYRDRWGRCVRHDEMVFYVEDGLLELLRAPSRLRPPWTRWRTEAHLLHTRMDQILDVLRETIRASVYEGDGENGGSTAAKRLPPRERRRLKKRIREAARELADEVSDVHLEDEPAATLESVAAEEPSQPPPEAVKPPEPAGEPEHGPAEPAAEADAEPADAEQAPAATEPSGYDKLVTDIVTTLDRALPAGAKVLVVSKGDDALLRVPGRECGHFPQDENGAYLGYHPKTGDDVVQLLDIAQSAGAEYFVLPATALWWLDHYGELAERLGQADAVIADPALCFVFQLADLTVTELVRSLLPDDARIAVVAGGSGIGIRNAVLFPRDLGDERAIEHLRRLRSIGVQYLVVPRDAFDWLESHPVLAANLRSEHRFVTRQHHACEIYELGQPSASVAVAVDAGRPQPAGAAAAHDGRARSRSLLRRRTREAGR